MTSLRTLGYFDLSRNLENNALNIGKLTNLQELHLTCSTEPSGRLLRNIQFVGSILRKLYNLKSLTLVPDSSHGNTPEANTSSVSISCDGLNSVNSPPALLQRLDLFPRICIFSSLPMWIRHLDNLYVLKIAVRELSSSDIHLILKELPALTALSLHVQTTPSTSIVIGQEGFPVLRFFTFKCALVCLTFHKGAMPNLERIKLRFCVNKEGLSSCVNAGLQHLSSLKEISAKLWPAGAGHFNRRVIEKAGSYFKSTIKEIVINPIVNVRCVQPIASPMFSESPARLATEEFKIVGGKPAMVTKKALVTAKPAIVTENAMVSAPTGAMNSVLMKLEALMGERYSKLTGMRNEAMILKAELDAASSILEQLADTGKAKDGRNKMREMTYDIEDWIDDLMFHFDEGTHQTITEERATLKKFIDQIRNITGRMEKAAPGSTTRKSEMSTLGSTYVASESLLSRVSDRGSSLVGVDGPRGQLVKRLIGGEQGLQVVCILGSVGVGKTTLAKEAYNTIKGCFELQAFITAPKDGDLLSQLKRRMGLLPDKRCLVVIDGVRSAQILNNIERAFPNNDSGSRIIITTCYSDVATSCGKQFSSFIYHMEPLTFEDSFSLFQSIIFGSGGSCPIALEEVAKKIVEACRGLPLAICLTASLLASRPAEMTEWDMVEKRMELSGVDPLSAEEWMRKILYLSYSDLSRDMKTYLLYLLYLSAFPNDYVIRKDLLIRRWIAEGFLPKINEESWWETGERFFLELIARKLMEPVFWEDLLEPVFVNEQLGPVSREDHHEPVGYDEMPLGCKTSCLVHDFIISLSSE